MHFRLLTAADTEALFYAFNLAFSQYIVKIQLSEEQFKTKLQREGVQIENSAGAFSSEGKLAGFILAAIGTWQGNRTAYNAGTGVIPAFRGEGITTGLYMFLLHDLQQQEVEQCLLEVIDANKPALHIYQELGFTKTRLLHCYRGPKDSLQLSEFPAGAIHIKQTTAPDWQVYRSFWDVAPSWQNSIEAIMRSPEEKFIVEASQGGKCVGYGIIFKESGGVAQLAVSRDYRKQGIGSGILHQLLQLTENKSVTFLNIDSGCKSLLSFLENRQVPLLLKQQEMVRRV